jgi:hypothetical protein
MSRSSDIPRIPGIKGKRIPLEATSIEGDLGDDELISLHFSQYVEKHCEIEHLDQAKAKGILRKLKAVGRSRPGELASANIQSTEIRDENDYAKYYNGLGADVKLFEVICSGTARVFYFSVGSKFYIRAITSKHNEYTKNRRTRRQKRGGH